MSYELYFTSAPKGLRPGASGFCTVAATRDLPGPLMEKVEALSGYRHLYSPLDENNPVVYSHVRIEVLGKAFHVLSRICAAGLDYSGRGNKFAHHVILEPDELPPGGPAWLLGQPGFMQTHWDGTVGYLPGSRKLPVAEPPPEPCRAWERLTGDAGWAGVLLQTTIGRQWQPVYCLYSPQVDLLPLIGEAINLLPAERRWHVSFTTHFTGMAPGIACLWRGVPDGTTEAEKIRRQNADAVFDIGRLQGAPAETALVDQARTGLRSVPAPAGGPEVLAGNENAPLLVGQAAGAFTAYRFREESNRPGQEVESAPVLNSKASPPPVLPPAAHAGHSPTPPVPPSLPPRLSANRPAGRLRWHGSSLALGALVGCLLALVVVLIFSWLHARPDFNNAESNQEEGSGAPMEKENSGAVVVANGKANPSHEVDTGRQTQLREITRQNEKLQEELKRIRQQSQEKDQTIKGLKDSLSKLEKKAAPLREEPKNSLTSVEKSGPAPVVPMVDGFLPIDPNQERSEELKLEFKGLPPQTNLSLFCQKQLGRPIRFEGQQRREAKDNDRWPVLNITFNGQSNDLGQFRVVEGQLTFAWTEREKNKPLRRTFIDSCLLVLENDQLGKKVLALAGPASDTKLKLAEEQGVFTLRPERLANWHGPDLFLDRGEFADRTQLKRMAGGNPRLLESEEYTVLLRQGPSSLVEIWPRRNAPDKPLLRKLVVYTAIKDYRIDVYRLDVSN